LAGKILWCPFFFFIARLQISKFPELLTNFIVMLLTGVRRARVNGNRLLGWAESRISHAPRSVIDTSLTAFAFGSHRHISTKLFIRSKWKRLV